MFESISIYDSTRMTRITRIRTDTRISVEIRPIRVIRVPGRYCWILYGFGLLKLFFAENSARNDSVVFRRFSPGRIPRRGTVGGTQGRIWGQEDAPPLEFMKAASET
jgi:hypothetical protein